eukprot:364637-Chlamydomonas_euryale.AAC.10
MPNPLLQVHGLLPCMAGLLLWLNRLRCRGCVPAPSLMPVTSGRLWQGGWRFTAKTSGDDGCAVPTESVASGSADPESTLNI